MPKVSQQHRDARREQILAAARRCFLRDGFHATSMQDLFAEAGLSSGAVYSYFASKDDVILAIAEENMSDLTDMIYAVATRQPARPVGAVLADALEMLHAKDSQDGLGKLTVIVWSEALRNPSLAARFTALVAQLRASLADVIQQYPGNLPRDVSADVLATALLSLVPGYLLQLALLGLSAVNGVPDAVRVVGPNRARSGLMNVRGPAWIAYSEGGFDPYAPYGPVVTSTIRVVTWNVWGRYGPDCEARQAALEETLVETAPDLVAWLKPGVRATGPSRPGSRPGWACRITGSRDWPQEDGYRASASCPGGRLRSRCIARCARRTVPDWARRCTLPWPGSVVRSSCSP